MIIKLSISKEAQAELLQVTGSLVACGWEFAQHTQSQQTERNSLMKDAFYIKRVYSDIKSAFIKILWPTQQEVY